MHIAGRRPHHIEKSVFLIRTPLRAHSMILRLESSPQLQSSLRCRQSYTASSMLLYRFSGLAAVVCLWSTAAATNSTCYYPNGKENNGGACNPNAEVSACCGPTFVCLSNGLCKPGPDSKKTYAYNFYRSGCTDATFNSTSCPQFCTDSELHIYDVRGLH